MELVKNKNQQRRTFEILKESFQSSAGMSWMVKNTGCSKSKARIIDLLLQEAKLKKGLYITSDGNGTLLLFQVKQRVFSVILCAKKLYTLLFITGLKKGIQAIRYQKFVAKVRPKNGLLGLLIATDQNARDCSAAFEIKQEMFRLADELNEKIYAETTIPRVRILYKLAGFEEYAEIQHPYAQLKIWFFKRIPQNTSTK